MRIGILGGTFNPAHNGHVHISKAALKMLKLDAIWWLVTPQNPLKSGHNLPSVEARIKQSHELTEHNPKIIVTDMEQHFATTYSYDSIKQLKKHYPNTSFVWITGMDNANNLHLWHNWKELLGEICMLHIARDEPIGLVKNSPARIIASQKHINLTHASNAELIPNTTYWLLQEAVDDISSTKIREITLIKDKKSI